MGLRALVGVIGIAFISGGWNGWKKSSQKKDRVKDKVPEQS